MMGGKGSCRRQHVNNMIRDAAARMVLKCEESAMSMAERCGVNQTAVYAWVRRYCDANGIRLTDYNCVCPRCGTVLKHYDIGFGRAKCRLCWNVFDVEDARAKHRRDYNRALREKNRDAIKSSAHKYYERHKDELRLRRKKRQLKALEAERNETSK